MSIMSISNMSLLFKSVHLITQSSLRCHRITLNFYNHRVESEDRSTNACAKMQDALRSLINVGSHKRQHFCYTDIYSIEERQVFFGFFYKKRAFIIQK